MTKVVFQAGIKMKNEKAESNKATNRAKNAAQRKKEISEDYSSAELSAPRWSVITFEQRAAKNLSYSEAAEKLAELSRKNISGLCIVTDEAGEKVS